MSYIVNVSRRGADGRPPYHVFRTAEDSLRSQDSAILLAKMLTHIFPKEVYEISVSHQTTHSEYIDWSEAERNAQPDLNEYGNYTEQP